MTTKVALKAFVIWLGILLLAIANGVLRESVFIGLFSAPVSIVLSGLLLSAMIIGVAYCSLPWFKTRSPAQFWLIGLGWLVLTLVFEFSFGLWQGMSWTELFGAYTFKGGNIWPAVLAVTALAPYIAAKLRRWV